MSCMGEEFINKGAVNSSRIVAPELSSLLRFHDPGTAKKQWADGNWTYIAPVRLPVGSCNSNIALTLP